jgi:hypothetical protein
VTQRKYCDFIVWTSRGINVETVETIVVRVGDQFMKNILPKLNHFYFKSTVQSLDTFLYLELAVPDPSGYLEMYKYQIFCLVQNSRVTDKQRTNLYLQVLSVVFMVALQAWLARLGNRSTNGSTAFKKRRGVARTLLE